MSKINVEWLRETDFDEKFYTQVVFVDNTYRTIDIWTDEKDIIEIEDRWAKVKQLELKRYYTPTHAKWLDDDVHRAFRFAYNLN